MMITKKKKNDTKMKAKEKEKISNYIIFMFHKIIIMQMKRIQSYIRKI